MGFKQTAKHLALSILAATERTPDVPLRDIRNFLLLQHASALGTVIHATPLIPALRAAVPDARIVVAASGFAQEIFRGNPGVDEVLSIPDPTLNFRVAGRELRRLLSLEGPFATLTTSGNERTGIAMAARIGGAGNRVGFTLAPELYRVPLVFEPSMSQIANNLRLVEALGHATSMHYEPQVFFSDDDLEYAKALARTPYGPPKRLAVFVTQTSPTQRKSWRPERFVAAAQFLIDRQGVDNILFVGSKSEREAIDAMLPGIRGRVHNVAGETNLGQLSALLSVTSIGLTLDTGTMHLGRAAGLPMVIIAPAWSPPVEWLPLNDPRFTILKNADMDHAPVDYIIDEVSVDEVTAALADLMERYPR